MKDTEGERVGVEFKNLLREIQAERIRRGTDKEVKSRKRICQGIVRLYEINQDFRQILLASDMPEGEDDE